MNIKKYVSIVFIFLAFSIVIVLYIMCVKPAMTNKPLQKAEHMSTPVTVIGKISLNQINSLSVKFEGNRIIKEILYNDDNTKPTIVTNEYHDKLNTNVAKMIYNYESIKFTDNNGMVCDALNLYCNTLDEAIEQSNSFLGRGNKIVGGSLKDFADFVTSDNLQAKKRKYSTYSLDGQKLNCIEYFVKAERGISIVKCYITETATEEYCDNMIINRIKY